MSNIVDVICVDASGKGFKTVPKHYRSSFNRLTLVSDEYRVYCAPIEDFLISQYQYNEDVQLAVEWLKQEVDNIVRQSMFEYNGGGKVKND